MKEDFNRLIREADSICILGHTNPDGDCLGSTLGTRQYIRNRFPDKKVTVYLQEASSKFQYLPGFPEIVHVPSDRKYDLAIVCDCAGKDRLGDFAILMEHAKETYVADHHLTNAGSFQYSTILPDASSTCEVVFDLMDHDFIDQDAATCLYTGIVHDTGVFKYSCTSPHTMEIAGFLMSRGIDFGFIIDDGYYMKTFAQQKIQAKVMLESELRLNDRAIVGWVTIGDMQKYHVTTKDTDSIVTNMRETRNVDCAVFAYEVSNQVFKVSLRSNNNALDVSRVAGAFGGGGHKLAAGCSLHGGYRDVLDHVLQEIAKQLDAPGFKSRNDE